MIIMIVIMIIIMTLTMMMMGEGGRIKVINSTIHSQMIMLYYSTPPMEEREGEGGNGRGGEESIKCR